ncbi:MAG TPA: dienelactone hydrolase family protein [Thermoplasmata archaeon]|nr:dienelactone hydrolase family protein [Thermoplasmata archaeon]
MSAPAAPPSVHGREVTVPAATGPLDCYLALPGGATGRRPAVIVIHEIFGADEHIRDVARRFAAQGYVAAAPDLFPRRIRALLTPEAIHRVMATLAHAPPELRRDPAQFASYAATQPPELRPILESFAEVTSPAAQVGFAQDLLALSRYLRSLPEVDPARVGSVGFCFGGAMSARLATVDPDLRAAVIFYGQNPPMEDVPRIRAAVLGLYGAEDPGITATVPQLADAMAKAGGQFSSHVYPGAKHAFFNETRPNYHAASAQDAWQRVLGFYASTLGTPVGRPTP